MIRDSIDINRENDECIALDIECTPFQSSSFSVLPIQHGSSKKNMTDSHLPDVIFVPVNKTDSAGFEVEPSANKLPEPSHLRDFDWPWNTEIYSNGDHIANGILLDKSWILIEKTTLGDIEESLSKNFVIALLGNPKSKLKIQSPYEQISRINCLQTLNDSNALLAHLQSPVDFNRHVLPSFLPIK